MNPATLWRLVPWSVLAAFAVLAFGLQPAGGSATAAAQSSCQQQAAALEELLAVRRAAAMASASGELPVAEIIATLRACWQEYERQMPAAEEDCEAYKRLAPDVLGWSRQVSLLGLDGEFAAEQERVMPWVARSLANCFNEAFDTCVDEHDPDRVFDMRRVERQLALMGQEDMIDTGKYEKCLRFEVVFETTLEHALPETGSATRVQVKTTVPVRGDYLFDLTGGQAPLEPIAFSHRVASFSAQGGCAVSDSSIQPGAPYKVLSLRFDRPEGAEGMSNPPARDLALTIDRGDTRERYSVDCPNPQDQPCPGTPGAVPGGSVTCQKLGGTIRITAEASHYALFFDYMHEDERADGGLTIRGWTMLDDGPVLARKTYRRSRPFADGVVTRTEDTTFELRHTPIR